VERASHCKVNLLLNILGKRADGFHELETVMQPVPLHDTLCFERSAPGIQFTCNHPALPTDATNLVVRAARDFFRAARLEPGVRIHLEKRLPVAAGLGGGSGNAAVTLLALNDLFGNPLNTDQLHSLAAALGSDVPFFLQRGPALATGRGEQVTPLPPFAALRGAAILLIHPGFGVSTAWAYQNLAKFPQALNGRPGRAQRLVTLLQGDDLAAAAPEFYNCLEAPVLAKHPLLALFQEFLREHGALAALMSGSGSSTFALTRGLAAAEQLAEQFRGRFGPHNWLAVAAL
jgi:4-diphosphocytidyl-2-C-methyl-D-erythritol kinase